MTLRARHRVPAALACAALLASCGGGSDSAVTDEGPTLVVAAPPILEPAVAKYASDYRYATVLPSFVGVGEVAKRARASPRPDADLVFSRGIASLEALYADGVVERPVAFATDRARPETRYYAAVVHGTRLLNAARVFLRSLTLGPGRKTLDEAGLGPAP